MKRFILAALLLAAPATAQPANKLANPVVVTEAYVNAVFEAYPAEVRDGRIVFQNNGTIRMTRWAADDPVPTRAEAEAKRPKTLVEILKAMDDRIKALEAKVP